MTSILALDVILRYAAAKSHHISGTTVFPKKGYGANLGDGRQVWSGYTQSVRYTQWKHICLNIDSKTSAFYKNIPLLDLACEMFRTNEHRYLQDGLSVSNQSHANNIKRLEDAIKGYEFEESSIYCLYCILYDRFIVCPKTY